MSFRSKYLWFIGIGMAVFSWWYVEQNESPTPMESPMESIPFDGPDKALARDFYMLRDPALNRIPYERLQEKRMQEHLRVENTRDFQWEGIDTKIPGRSRLLFLDQSASKLYSGSVNNGLWVMNNFPASTRWEKVGSFPSVSVSSMVQDPQNANLLVVGTGESFTALINYRESSGLGNGIYFSQDGGTKWAQMPNTESFYYVNDMIYREENGQSALYVAVGSGEYRGRTFIQEGLYRTVDNGQTWTQVLPNANPSGELYQVSDLELGPDNTLYAGTMRNAASKDYGGTVLFSDDGVNWSVYDGIYTDYSSNNMPGRTLIKVAPSNANHIYAITAVGFTNSFGQTRDYDVVLRQSIDGGQQWTDITLPNDWANIPWHALGLAVDPNNENKILIGAIDLLVLEDTQATNIAPETWKRLTYWAADYFSDDPNLTQAQRDYYAAIYLHADIHDIQFYNGNSNEVLITTDGGVFQTSDMGNTSNFNPEISTDNYLLFNQLNHSLNTTQYYHAALHPEKGVNRFLGGTQDNGSIFTNLSTGFYEERISGGDGGFSYWDADDPQLMITSVYGNRYYIHVNNSVWFINETIDGLFINPGDYDEEANLIYSNAATSSMGGRYENLIGRYFDTLKVVNVNAYINKPTLNLPVSSYIPLNGGIDEAITAIQLVESTQALNRTAIIGTEGGKVYKVTGLPYDPVTTEITGNNIPYGYISSIDVGLTENRIMITISNFGLSSVFFTRDGGSNWVDLEDNLPDIPVRWGVFNPYDDTQMMIATEMGIWGHENIIDDSFDWVPYNLGLPSIRIDMIDVRKSDSTILAATHGEGFYVGTFTQGPKNIVLSTQESAEEISTSVYPNPAQDYIMIETELPVSTISLMDIQGRVLKTENYHSQSKISVSELGPGAVIVLGYDDDGKLLFKERVLKR